MNEWGFFSAASARTRSVPCARFNTARVSRHDFTSLTTFYGVILMAPTSKRRVINCEPALGRKLS